MAVQTPPVQPAADQDVEAGVIEDARARQRRHRGLGAAFVVAVIAAVALIVGLSGGGGGGSGAGHTRGGHGFGAGSLGHGPFVAITSPSPAFLADAIQQCNKQVSQHYRALMKLGSIANPFTAERTLTAASGKYVGLISIVHATMHVCATTVPHRGPYGLGFGAYGRALAAPGADQLRSHGFIGTANFGGNETWTYGRAGRDISAVSFVFTKRPTVEAKVENGWYMAWWPGSPGEPKPTSVHVKTSSGTISSPLPGQCTNHASSCVFVN